MRFWKIRNWLVSLWYCSGHHQWEYERVEGSRKVTSWRICKRCRYFEQVSLDLGYQDFLIRKGWWEKL